MRLWIDADCRIMVSPYTIKTPSTSCLPFCVRSSHRETRHNKDRYSYLAGKMKSTPNTWIERTMLGDILVCAFVSFFMPVATVNASVGLRFLGDGNSYAEYDAWNWNSNGTMQLYFKTSSDKNAWIFYQDRKNDGDDVESQFMDLFLEQGGAGLRFRARVGNEVKSCLIRGHFHNSQWHGVSVKTSDAEICVCVNETSQHKCMVTLNAQYPSSKFNGELFIGGISFKRREWSYPAIYYEVYGFQGCIGGLKYSRSPNGPLVQGRLQKSHNAADNCPGACANHNKCQNGGRCVDNVVDFKCDCLGTGYEGLYCNEASTIVFMDSKRGNIFYTLTRDDPLWFTERNSLDFRFLKDTEDGVLFYMGRDADHLLVELVNGSLRVQADFGGGALELYLDDISLSKNCWHFVQVSRSKTFLAVSVDHGRSGNASGFAQGNFTTLNLNNQSDVIYFGGGPSDALVFSKAKNPYYSGYLQQFRFENFQVLDEARYGRNGFEMYRVGIISQDNDFLKDAKKRCDSSAASRCSPSDGDTDNCTPAPTPTSGRRTMESTSPPPTEQPPSTESRTLKSSAKALAQGSNADPTPRPTGVAAWLVIVIVLSAVVLVIVSVFALYRWNNRYTGSFKPSKNEEAQMQNAEEGSNEKRSRRYEQPAFFVYTPPNKPPTAQSPPVSI